MTIISRMLSRVPGTLWVAVGGLVALGLVGAALYYGDRDKREAEAACRELLGGVPMVASDSSGLKNAIPIVCVRGEAVWPIPIPIKEK